MIRCFLACDMINEYIWMSSYFFVIKSKWYLVSTWMLILNISIIRWCLAIVLSSAVVVGRLFTASEAKWGRILLTIENYRASHQTSDLPRSRDVSLVVIKQLGHVRVWRNAFLDYLASLLAVLVLALASNIFLSHGLHRLHRLSRSLRLRSLRLRSLRLLLCLCWEEKLVRL